MRLPVPEEVVFVLGTKLIEQGHLLSAIAVGLQLHAHIPATF